jgi:peptidoglycan biosynthesis protein MviN/MurJ (putative lipid II flippase)
MRRFYQRLRQRYAALDPGHKRIARGALWVTIFVLVSKSAVAARDIAIAYRYGVSGVVDAYYLATTLVTWVPLTFVSVLSIVLIPMFVRLRTQSIEEHGIFLREMHGSVLIVGIVLGVGSILVTPYLLSALGGHLSETTRHMVWQFTLGMAPVGLLALMTGVYAARLMARERQANTMLESVPALVILTFVALWPLGGDIAPLLLGTVLGMTIQTGWLSQLVVKMDGARIAPRLSWHSSLWREFRNAASVMAIGQLFQSFIMPLDQYTAAQLGDTAIATLGYANRGIGLVLGLGTIAISRSILPVLTDLVACRHGVRARKMALKWAILMLILGAVVALFSWLLAPWVVELLFERGAFGAQDTVAVTKVFRWALVQIPFFFAGLVLVQLLASEGRYRVISLLGISNLIVKVILNFVLSEWLGISGIAFATGLMFAWSSICLYYFAIVYQRQANS